MFTTQINREKGKNTLISIIKIRTRTEMVISIKARLTKVSMGMMITLQAQIAHQLISKEDFIILMDKITGLSPPNRSQETTIINKQLFRRL